MIHQHIRGTIESSCKRGAYPTTLTSRAPGGWCALPFLAVVLSACGVQEGRIERSVRQASLAYPRPVEGRLSVAGRFARWDQTPAAHRHDPAPFSDSEDKRVLRGSRPPLGNREP